MLDFKKLCIVTFYEDPVYLVVLENMCFDMKYNFADRCMHTVSPKGGLHMGFRLTRHFYDDLDFCEKERNIKKGELWLFCN